METAEKQEFKNIFPDLNRMRLESKVHSAINDFERELATALLHLYDRGQIEVSNDILTGEIMVRESMPN